MDRVDYFCSKASYADYEWSADAAANKPSTPFKMFANEKAKPGSAAAEIEGKCLKYSSTNEENIKANFRPVNC